MDISSISPKVWILIAVVIFLIFAIPLTILGVIVSSLVKKRMKALEDEILTEPVLPEETEASETTDTL